MGQWTRSVVGKKSPLSFATVLRCKSHSILAQKSALSELPSPEPFPVQSRPPVQLRPDPNILVATELTQLRHNLLNLLGSTHPGLREISKHYLLRPSCQFRSLVVLLISRATNGLGRNWELKHWEAESEVSTGRSAHLDGPLRHSDVLDNAHPAMPLDVTSFQCVFELRAPGQASSPLSPSLRRRTIPFVAPSPLILPTQLRLAQIAEMIHIASILHNEVCDSECPSKMSSGFGNKLSILGGDFLLGRASTALARLGENEVVELIAGVIANLVEGEFLRMQDCMQSSPGHLQLDGPKTIDDAWDIYLRKTYLKTASLIAKSARAASILGGSEDDEIWKDAAYAYGRNLGMAYQLFKDSAEYEAGGESLATGMANGPVLFAADEHPGMHSLIRRNFSESDDLELAANYVSRSSGVERTRDLARSYAERAREVLQLLPDSEAKDALEIVTETVVID